METLVLQHRNPFVGAGLLVPNVDIVNAADALSFRPLRNRSRIITSRLVSHRQDSCNGKVLGLNAIDGD